MYMGTSMVDWWCVATDPPSLGTPAFMMYQCAVELYHAPHLWYLHSTPLRWLLVLSNIEPPALQRKAATDKLVQKIVKHDSWPIQPDP